MATMVRGWCAAIVGAVMCAGGCFSQPLELADDKGPAGLLLVGYGGEVLGAFGDPSPAAIELLAERISYAREVIGDIDVDCDPHDGRVLVAETSYSSREEGTPWRVVVWRDWVSDDDPLEFDRIVGQFFSASFMELLEHVPGQWGRRSVVDLADVSKEYAVPDDLRSFVIRPDGCWVGLTEEELLSGVLGEERFLIERRMPFLSSLRAMGELAWVPGERYVLIGSSLPMWLRGEPGNRNPTVLLDWERWEIVDQPSDMRLHTREVMVVDGEPVFLAIPKDSHRWRYAVLSEEGGLVWSDWRMALPWRYEPQYVSPDGGLILSRQESWWLLYPGASPRLRVSTLSPKSERRDLMKMPFESVAGWLTAPVAESP